MSFHDASVFCDNGKFATNVYRKETFTGVYIHWNLIWTSLYVITVAFA